VSEPTSTTTTTTNDAGQPQGAIVARYGRYYRNTRYLIAALCIGYGLWSIYDGFVRYPRANEAEIQKEVTRVETASGKPVTPEERREIAAKTTLPHGGWDVPFNQWIGIILPPVGLAMLAWMLYNSRGEYRLERDTLHVPGHPPVPMDNIRKIDKRLWERKGIAYIEYEVPQSLKRAQFKLDDFIYERGPTDAIFERIEKHVADMVQGHGAPTMPT
jgi:hypothetical protein